jgi:hypothetical protein
MMDTKFAKRVDAAGFVRFSAKENPDRPIDWSNDYTEELKKYGELVAADVAAHHKKEIDKIRRRFNDRIFRLMES